MKEWGGKSQLNAWSSSGFAMYELGFSVQQFRVFKAMHRLCVQRWRFLWDYASEQCPLITHLAASFCALKPERYTVTYCGWRKSTNQRVPPTVTSCEIGSKKTHDTQVINVWYIVKAAHCPQEHFESFRMASLFFVNYIVSSRKH